jgi:hypothetical protein
LILSLSADCISVVDAYPWKDIDMNDVVSFISLQLSKLFFLVSVLLYASRWIFMMIHAKYNSQWWQLSNSEVPDLPKNVRGNANMDPRNNTS